MPDTNPILPDSIPNAAEELSMLKNMPLDEFINKLVSSTVTFVINLAIAVAVFYLGRFIINRIYRMLSNVFVKRKVEASLTTFVLSMVRIVLFFILIVTVIGIIGLETSSFLAIFASAGVAIGMALSGTLQNFAGGVLILLLKPYKIGDFIAVQGYEGTVREIQIFSTIITTTDNKSILIPNGALSTGTINNFSREAYRRISWVIGISYGDDVDVARAKILEILAADSRIITDQPGREAKVVVDALADSSVNLKVNAWVNTPDYWPVFYDINEQIYKQLPETGVSFPFPQLDVHQVQ